MRPPQVKPPRGQRARSRRGRPATTSGWPGARRLRAPGASAARHGRAPGSELEATGRVPPSWHATVRQSWKIGCTSRANDDSRHAATVDARGAGTAHVGRGTLLAGVGAHHAVAGTARRNETGAAPADLHRPPEDLTAVVHPGGEPHPARREATGGGRPRRPDAPATHARTHRRTRSRQRGRPARALAPQVNDVARSCGIRQHPIAALDDEGPRRAADSRPRAPGRNEREDGQQKKRHAAHARELT